MYRLPRKHWPSKEENAKLQAEENKRADEFDYMPDPICDCGEVGYACVCDELAAFLGYYSDGSPYIEK